MKKQYFLMSDEGEHEYTINFKEKKDIKTYSLRASNGTQWDDSFKDNELIRVVDTGNGLQILPMSFELDREVNGYDDGEYLHLILDFIYRVDEGMGPGYKLLETTEIK